MGLRQGSRRAPFRVTPANWPTPPATSWTASRLIYEESRKVVEEAGELWEHGRKLVGV